MIEKLFHEPHVLHQKTSTPYDVPEMPICASVDSSGLVVLSQEGRFICINPEAIPELKSLLTIMEKFSKVRKTIISKSAVA